MKSKESPEVPLKVSHRTPAEILRYLQLMQSFERKEIAREAIRARVQWKSGNREPALTVLTKWYRTLRETLKLDHSLNERCGTLVDMDTAISSQDANLHLDFLVQMIVTLKEG